MVIWNLTSENEAQPTVYDLLGFADIKCYKGARKTGSGESTRPGADLKEKIRVVTSHKRAIAILKDLWGNPTPNNDPFTDNAKPQGEWLREELHLYLALEDPELTFETSMKAFDGTGVQLMCDRQRIHKEATTIQTYKGTRRVLKDCSKPCVLADSDPDDWDCPLGCKPAGILHFYLRECLDNDAMIHAQFETKAFGDVPQIMKKLRAIKNELGSISQSPVPCYWTRHKIPLILSRVMRGRKRPVTEVKPQNEWKGRSKEYRFTGKKGDAEFYDLDLQVDPVWMDWYRKQKLLEELRARGLNPSREVVVGLLSGDIAIDVQAITSSVVEIPALPPLSQPPVVEQSAVTTNLLVQPRSQKKVTEEQIVQLENVLMDSGWTEEAIALLLQNHNIVNPSEMTQEQWIEVCAIASSTQSAREYNDTVLAPGTVTVMPANLTPEDWTERLYPAFKKHGWVKTKADGKPDNSRLFAMLQAEYGITRIGELLVSQIPEILELITSSEVRDRWLKT